MSVEARLIRTLGETRGAQVVALAKVLGDQDGERANLAAFADLPDAPNPQLVERRPTGPEVRVLASDAAAAGGTVSTELNAMILRQTVEACGRDNAAATRVGASRCA
jgi:hypothetical protein